MKKLPLYLQKGSFVLGFSRVNKFLIVLFSLLVLSACLEENSSNSSGESFTNTKVALNNTAPRVVVKDAYIDLSGELMILGNDFDSGSWPEPRVFLDGIELTVIQTSTTGNAILADLGVDDDIDDNFLLTVQTGDDLANFDTLPLFPVNAVPSGVLTQLVLVAVEANNIPGLITLKFNGYNITGGNWPPEVTINDIPQLVDADDSSAELLTLIIPDSVAQTILDMQEDIVLAINTGTVTEQYDAFEFSRSLLEDDGVELACNRTDHQKVPVEGEHCCTTAKQDLCWRTGPIREDTKNFFFNSDEIPRYFELTEDYVMPIDAYFSDPPPVAFPDFWRVIGDGDPDTKRERLAPLLPGLPLHFSTNVASLVDTRKWDFLDYVDGNLIIKKGYRWDGASVGWDRALFDDRLLRTYLVNMRSSLVHDAFYDLIRFCALPCDTTDRAPVFGGKEDYRDVADTLFYLVAKEDGHTNGLKIFYKTLRRLGQTKARKHAEDNASWRFHTAANASVSSSGGDMVVDALGNKTFAMTCAMGDNVIELDAGNSWPIARQPQEGEYQPNLHDTDWTWALDGVTVFQGTHEYPTGDLLNQPDTFKTNVTIDELVSLGMTSGTDHALALSIDKGKDTLEGEFQSEDEITLSLELDTEPPQIIGITVPLNAWPPNGKYRTFMIDDFVSSVTDNCSDVSFEDLVITQVISNEPDNGRGDGNTINDIVVSTDNKSVDLRIERQGMGNGRYYTVSIQAVDESGNVQVSDFQVKVPHNQ